MRYSTRNNYSRKNNVGPQRNFTVVSIFVFAFAALVLLVLNRIQSDNIRTLRYIATETLSPVMQLAAGPAAYINKAVHSWKHYYQLSKENEHLKTEIAALKQYKRKAEKLQSELKQIKKINKIKTAFQNQKALTVRLIADERSQFSKSFLVNAGHQNGIRDGLAVMDENGLVGRTIHTGKSVSRLLLMSDPLSRIPVFIGDQRVKAIISGNGNQPLSFSYLSNKQKIHDGDIVVTSGLGNTFPAGIRLGKIVKNSDGLQIKPDSQKVTTDYVRVLLKNTPSAIVNQKNKSDRLQPRLADQSLIKKTKRQ